MKPSSTTIRPARVPARNVTYQRPAVNNLTTETHSAPTSRMIIATIPLVNTTESPSISNKVERVLKRTRSEEPEPAEALEAFFSSARTFWIKLQQVLCHPEHWPTHTGCCLLGVALVILLLFTNSCRIANERRTKDNYPVSERGSSFSEAKADHSTPLSPLPASISNVWTCGLCHSKWNGPSSTSSTSSVV